MKSSTLYSIHYEQQGAIWELSSALLHELPFDDPNLVFVCIATDCSTGDALGPLTGSFLSLYMSFPFQVFGTLEHPIHALNLGELIDSLAQQHSVSKVVAIDACLGQTHAIGDILLDEGPLWPGKAVQKTLPAVGDYSIKAIVNHMHGEGLETLQSTRLHLTHDLARVIANALFLAWHRHLTAQQTSMPHIAQPSVNWAAN